LDSDSLVLAKRRTLKLHEKVGKIVVLILVDSESVGTFISEALAQRLQLPIISCPSAQYVAADGSPMLCNQKIVDLQWSAQGYTFTSTMGILPLRCFDMILGQDWLEECSPMLVHWTKKLMKFTRDGTRIHLQGVIGDVSKCQSISKKGLKGLIGLKGLMRRQAISHCVHLRVG
jgi:hypothetical protein